MASHWLITDREAKPCSKNCVFYVAKMRFLSTVTVTGDDTCPRSVEQRDLDNGPAEDCEKLGHYHHNIIPLCECQL